MIITGDMLKRSKSKQLNKIGKEVGLKRKLFEFDIFYRNRIKDEIFKIVLNNRHIKTEKIIKYRCTNCNTTGMTKIHIKNHIGDKYCSNCGYYNLMEEINE